MPTAERLFCSKPFEWFEVTQLNGRGGVYLCCPSWLDRPVGQLQHESVAEIWNGQAAQEIRRSILDGSFKYCNGARCPYLQTRTGPVTSVEEVAEDRLKAVIEHDLTVLPYGPPKVICTYDQSCNLSCPSCRTKLIVERDDEQAILRIQNTLQTEALKEADFLHITGSGDPFGSPYFRRWLQSMKKQDVPRLEWIHLHSNGLLWTPKMWRSISEDVRQLIKSAEISIDAAAAATYTVNRRGGSFETLLKNLGFISTLRRDGPLTFLKISMVVQANNFTEMPDFVRLGQRLSCDQVYFSQLVNWGTFSEHEFARRAVHLPRHPQRPAFIDVLQDGIFNAPIVDLGNLTDTRNAPRQPAFASLRRGSRHFGRLPKKIWSKVQTHLLNARG